MVLIWLHCCLFELSMHVPYTCHTRKLNYISPPACFQDKNSLGSLLELTWNGQHEVEFDGGVKRKFIEDGDEIMLTGYCKSDRYIVGFGECVGKILPTTGKM